MPTPKAQTKVLYKKGECTVEYTDNLDATQYYMHELTRAALRDVGKFVSKKFRESYEQNFRKITKKAAKSIKYNVYSSKSTTNPRVEVGIKGGYLQGTYSMFQEFGSYHTPRLGLLHHAVEDNVAEIVRIESQYLSGLEDEANRLESMLNENEYEGDSDEN